MYARVLVLLRTASSSCLTGFFPGKEPKRASTATLRVCGGGGGDTRGICIVHPVRKCVLRACISHLHGRGHVHSTDLVIRVGASLEIGGSRRI